MDWYLSVTDHIVEFVPIKQNNNGVTMEVILSPSNLYISLRAKLDLVLAGDMTSSLFVQVMSTRQRTDLLMNIPALRKLDLMLIVRTYTQH